MSEKEITRPQEGSQCLHCELYDEESGTCGAFYPNKIPQDILSGKSTHEKPVEGQTIEDIVFMPTDEYLYPTL